MTLNQQDYLAAIYKLGGREKLVGNKQIAQKLRIAPASVTEMLGKLKNDGLIQYEAYKGSRLTMEGQKRAIPLVRGHRLWEVFLMQHLGYSWSEAHEEAERLEHATSARLAARLERFLNYPAYCPHGSPVPAVDGESEYRQLQTLDSLKVGASAFICRVTEEKELLDYLQSCGLRIGAAVKVLEVGAYEGPLTIEMDGEQLQISYRAARQVYVDGKNP